MKKYNTIKIATELLASYQEYRDNEQLNKLIKLISPLLLKKIKMYIKDYDDSYDILQKTLIKIKDNNLKYIPALSPPDNWIFWNISYSIIQHYFRDKKISNSRFSKIQHYSDDENSTFDSFASSEPNPHQIVVKKELFSKLHFAIKSLKINYEQDVIILHHFGGFELKDIACLMNQKYATIRTWHARAKENLFNALKQFVELR